MHTPGHTRDSMCLQVEDRLFTGDTLLFGATGRTDLPTGDPEALHDSLFNRLLQGRSGDARGLSRTRLQGTEDTRRSARELATNPRLQKAERAAFVAMMRNLDLSDADASHRSASHQPERWQDRGAASRRGRRDGVPFMSLEELKARVESAGTRTSSFSTYASAMRTRTDTSPAHACCLAASSS